MRLPERYLLMLLLLGGLTAQGGQTDQEAKLQEVVNTIAVMDSMSATNQLWLGLLLLVVVWVQRFEPTGVRTLQPLTPDSMSSLKASTVSRKVGCHVSVDGSYSAPLFKADGP